LRQFQASVLCVFLAVLPSFAADSIAAIDKDKVSIFLDGARHAGDCKLEESLLLTELHQLHFPAGWRIAIVCTSLRWQQILQQRDLHYNTRGFTNLKSQLTVLDGVIFREFPSNYRHIIAHELAHIQCQCRDETMAERIARDLEHAAKLTQDAARIAGKQIPQAIPASDLPEKTGSLVAPRFSLKDH